MSTLTLVSQARPPVPVGVEVEVDHPVPLACDDFIRRGTYRVLAAEWTPPEHRQLGPYRLTIRAAPDCSGMPETHRPGSEYRRRKGLASRPACARPKRLFLYPGDFRLLAGEQLVTLPDHPLQND